MKKNYLILVVLFVISSSFNRCSSDVQTTIPDDWPSDSIRIVKNGFNYPWEILWGKDNFIWMTERGGKINKINPKTGDIVFTASIADVVSNGEGGLLGMVQHPGFLTNGLFYVVYNYNNGSSYREKLVQMKFENNSIQPVKTLLQDIPASSIHNGSRIWISDDAMPMLFFTTGDASNQSNAQNTSSLSGKVLRLHLDGTIPADNPFAGSPVWSFGHRNQQGLVVANGIMYASEHGPNIEDEVNIIEKGRNYGWPNVNGPCDAAGELSFCTSNNVKEPIWSSGSSTIAVSGMDYYNNNRIPAWQNSLLMCTLKDATLRVLTLSADGRSVVNTQTLYKNVYGRIRDICISPAGRVYLCTSNGSNADVLVEISKP
ncbi:MAG: PQQ-dependent sugar dehydrogenase [Ferruginibacter sp.]|nr:PQQ-dependent sugar dehydrogenase [Ferruginibacter sp.]MCB0709827.1 PQQ-dependent sugar dehydrogenase [Chitinophagaceae bacterium]